MNLSRPSNQLFRKQTPEHLAALRIVVFGIWAVTLMVWPMDFYASWPKELFAAPGIFGLLPEAWWTALTGSGVWLSLLRAAALAACMGAILGWGGRGVALMAAGLILLITVLNKGHAGFINHNDLGPLYMALLIPFLPAFDAWIWPGKATRHGANEATRHASLTVAALLITLPYCFIGLNRVLEGGAEIFTGPALRHWLVVFSYDESPFPFTTGIWLVNQPLLMPMMQVGFAAVTLLEILAPLMLLSVWFRRGWLVIMIPFHVLTLLTMNIFFWQNILILLCLFIDWPDLMPRCLRARGHDADSKFHGPLL